MPLPSNGGSFASRRKYPNWNRKYLSISSSLVRTHQLPRTSQGELRDAGVVVERGPGRSVQKDRGRLVQPEVKLPIAFEHGIRMGAAGLALYQEITGEALSRKRNNRVVQAIQLVLKPADTVAAGKRWQFVRVSDLPLEVLPPTFVSGAQLARPAQLVADIDTSAQGATPIGGDRVGCCRKGKADRYRRKLVVR